MELADLVVVMSMGRIEQIDKPQDIRAKPATAVVRQFILVPRAIAVEFRRFCTY